MTVNPDQTSSFRRLICVYTVCSDPLVPIFQLNRVSSYYGCANKHSNEYVISMRSLFLVLGLHLLFIVLDTFGKYKRFF